MCIIRCPCDVIHVQLLRLLCCFILLFIFLMHALSIRGVLRNMLIFSVNLQIQLIDVIFVNILPSPSDRILSIVPLLIDAIQIIISLPLREPGTGKARASGASPGTPTSTTVVAALHLFVNVCDRAVQPLSQSDLTLVVTHRHVRAHTHTHCVHIHVFIEPTNAHVGALLVW